MPLSIAFFLIGHDEDRRLAFAAKGLDSLLAVLSLYALYQYFFRPDMLFVGRVHAPLVDPNGLAAVFSLGLFLILRAALRSPKVNIWRLVQVFLLGAALLTTGSRGALLSFALMTAVGLCAYGPQRIGKRMWGALLGLGLAALVLTAAIVPDENSGPVRLAERAYEMGVRAMIGSRTEIWASTLQLIAAHPWIGTGIGTFAYYYPEVRSPSDTTYGFMAHNDPLQFGAEMGVGAIALFYLVLVAGLVRTVRALRRLSSDDQAGRLDIIAPACGIAAMVLHAHITFNFHVLPCLMLAGFAVALWYRATAAALAETSAIIKAPRWSNEFGLQVLFLLVAFLMSVLAAAPVYTQRLFISANQALARGDIDRFGHDVNLADTLSLGLSSQAYLLAAQLPLSAILQADAPLSDQQRQDMVAKADMLLAKAWHYNPRDAAVLYAQAKLEDARGNQERAEEYLSEALRLNPLHVASRLMLAEHLSRRADPHELDVLLAGIDYVYAPEQAADVKAYYLRAVMLLTAAGRSAEAARLQRRLEEML